MDHMTKQTFKYNTNKNQTHISNLQNLLQFLQLQNGTYCN